ncbi:CPBP family intramembrane glutamic endopeptidase [Formosa sp. A9]|uniref:CPBP family intramembrane glutamic endopeptidase n=1 Tax=Formosa sp. A9 TaxID=3442641 RepID=UPI003EC07C75
MHTFIDITTLFIQFLLKPNCYDKTWFKNYSIIKVFVVALIWSFILNFGFTIVFSILDILQIINFEDHANTKLFEEFPPYAIVLLGVVAAPIFEELIFRAPIPLFCRFTKWFPLIFYIFAFTFGAVHITNFEITRNVLILMPILVAPQILIGLFLGVIRLQFGLLYSMLFHAIYNGILIIPAVLLM